jgi:two-component system response regulator BaeR
MLTARIDEVDRLIGLESGADDYICKPFSPREVVARVKAILRRVAHPMSASEQGLHLDENRLEVRFLDQPPLMLTLVEFQLIKALASQPGRIWSRQKLMELIYPDHRIVSDRTIDSHIKKLRRKLTDHFTQGDWINTVYGVGYRLQLDE